MDTTVQLQKPLGIVLEECEPGCDLGVRVAQLVSGGNAEACGKISVGDKLIAVSATFFIDEARGEYERRMMVCTTKGYDEIMAAIGSNSGRWGYTDVRLRFRLTDESQPRPAVAQGSLPRAPVPKIGMGIRDLPIRAPRDAWDKEGK